MKAQNHIAYMEAHKMTKVMLEGLPSKLPGLPQGCLIRLRTSGIISRKARNEDAVATWDRGCYYQIIMKAWK